MPETPGGGGGIPGGGPILPDNAAARAGEALSQAFQNFKEGVAKGLAQAGQAAGDVVRSVVPEGVDIPFLVLDAVEFLPF